MDDKPFLRRAILPFQYSFYIDAHKILTYIYAHTPKIIPTHPLQQHLQIQELVKQPLRHAT